jgi:prolyl oligopeptidase
MKKILFLPIILFFMSACSNSPFQYPETRKVDVSDTYFGKVIQDPYRWLENDTAADVKKWVEAQNELTFGYLKSIPYRDSIRDRLTAMWNYERLSTPYREGGHYFFWKNDGLQNQNVLYMARDLKSEPAVLLDPNKLSKDGTVAVSLFSASRNGKYGAYGISRGGSDWVEIFVKDLATGVDLADHLQWVKFSGVSWYHDGFYYSRYDEPGKGAELTNQNAFQKVYYHRLGTEQNSDVLIYQNPSEPSRMYGAWVSEDENWLVIYESEWSSKGNALWVQDLRKPGSDLVCVRKGFDYDNTAAGIFKNKLYLVTNQDAPRRKLLQIDISMPDAPVEKELLPQTGDVLQNCVLAGGKIIAEYLHDVKSTLNIFNLDGTLEGPVELPAIGTIEGVSGNMADQTAFYSFTSFTFPSTIFKYDLKTGKSEVWFAPKVDFDPSKFEIEQVFYPGKDGTRIPMFMVYKKGLKKDGSNPAWLYGYGGFNITQSPAFRISRLLWLENGGIYAVACIRGGGEYGEEWHEAGTKLKKQNVFDDFIAAAEYLVKDGFTAPGKLVIQGGSNGGLLVGAVINQRPELFRVALPAVGVMDMLRFQKFTIGAAWVADYGSSDDSVQFNYLLGYSPIHNIRKGLPYPAVLVTTADHDDRVVPAHSFKYISTLQENYKGDNPVMIRIQTQAGHGAGKPTSVAIEETADLYAFTFWNLGLKSLR